MSVVNAGRVELDLVALARDEVTATLRQANRSLEGTKVQMEAVAAANNKAAKATGDFGSSLMGLKEKVKPLDQARGAIENLKANFLGLPTLIIGAVGAVGSLIEKLIDAGSAQERLRVKASEYAKALEGVKKDIIELRKLNGESVSDEQSGPLGAEAGERVVQLDEKISTATDRIRRLRAQIVEWKSAGVSFLESSFIDRAEREIAKLTTEITETAKVRAGYEEQAAIAIERQNAALKEQKQQEATNVQNSLWALIPHVGFSGDPFANATAAKPASAPPRRTGGGGGVRPPKPITADDLIKELSRDSDSSEKSFLGDQRSKEESAWRERMAKYAADEARAVTEAEEAKKAAQEAELERVDMLKASYREYGEIIGSALPAQYGEFINALVQVGELSAENGEAGEKEINLAEAIGKSVIKLGATQARTARARNLWKAAEETAEAVGAAARYDYGAAALHGAAAVLHLAAAAKAGGGGGGGAGGRPSGGAGGPSSLDRGGGNVAPSTVVYNVDVKPGTDPQAVVRELNRIEYASRSTGLPVNRGV